MYAIVADKDLESFWIQGDEGRVNESLFGSLLDALDAAHAMRAGGADVDCGSYYVDSGDGPNWDWPYSISENRSVDPWRLFVSK